MCIRAKPTAMYIYMQMIQYRTVLQTCMTRNILQVAFVDCTLVLNAQET